MLHDQDGLTDTNRRRERRLAAHSRDPAREIDQGPERTEPVFDAFGLKADDDGIADIIDDAAIKLMSLTGVRQDDREWRRRWREGDRPQLFNVCFRRGARGQLGDDPRVTPHSLIGSLMPLQKRDAGIFPQTEDTTGADKFRSWRGDARPTSETVFDVGRSGKPGITRGRAIETAQRTVAPFTGRSSHQLRHRYDGGHFSLFQCMSDKSISTESNISKFRRQAGGKPDYCGAADAFAML